MAVFTDKCAKNQRETYQTIFTRQFTDAEVSHVCAKVEGALESQEKGFADALTPVLRPACLCTPNHRTGKLQRTARTWKTQRWTYQFLSAGRRVGRADARVRHHRGA